MPGTDRLWRRWGAHTCARRDALRAERGGAPNRSIRCAPHFSDRDRVIRSAAFRRLEYKTQVFVNHEGGTTDAIDPYDRGGANHANGGTLAQLNGNSPSDRAAHDLGHTPFGHAGERFLNQLMELTAASTITRKVYARSIDPFATPVFAGSLIRGARRNRQALALQDRPAARGFDPSTFHA